MGPPQWPHWVDRSHDGGAAVAVAVAVVSGALGIRARYAATPGPWGTGRRVGGGSGVRRVVRVDPIVRAGGRPGGPSEAGGVGAAVADGVDGVLDGGGAGEDGGGEGGELGVG